MMRDTLSGWTPKHLGIALAMFFLALAIPAAVLVYHAWSQLKWEAFHQYRVQAEELAARIDSDISRTILTEEARPVADYAFLVVAGDPAANFVQRSPLSAYPVDASIPGLIGYFQVDADSTFSTPLLPPPGTEPATLGIDTQELAGRTALVERLRDILGRNRLVRETGVHTPAAAVTAEQDAASHVGESLSKVFSTAKNAAGEAAPAPAAPAAEPAGQAAFDRLYRATAETEAKRKPQAGGTLGRVDDLQLEEKYPAGTQDKAMKRDAPAQRSARKEQGTLATLTDKPGMTTESRQRVDTRIHTFESEIDPFEFSRLDSGEFVLYRKVWRDGQRIIQGALIEPLPFLDGIIRNTFAGTTLADMSNLLVAFRGDILDTYNGEASRGYGGEDMHGALLYRTRLSAPLGDLELIFSITRLPAGPGAGVVAWVAAVLLLVLCGGFVMMYRLGAGQIELARQQQDFVSAVSHELKTPLTSIRMYGEMLREGWAPEDKKQTYYSFIQDESERLSRLITNVLQLSRMSRNEIRVDLKPVGVAELLDDLQSKLATQVGRAGFTLQLDCDDSVRAAVLNIDADAFAQIIINLVDNALKFSAKAERKIVEIGCRTDAAGRRIVFSVRDYGPGIPAGQMKRIFRLFYRLENELTRETVGTGIGLALVHQLVIAMDGEVDVVNAEPGAEFRVGFRYSDNLPHTECLK